MGKQWKEWETFLGSKITADGDCSHEIKKNTFESVLMRWMKLEPIIQSEVSQKEKPVLYTNTYIWNLERWQ